MKSNTLRRGQITRLIKAYFSYISGRSKCSYLPMRIWIEPTNVCNLKCKICAQSREKGLRRGFMELALFEVIIRQIRGFAFDVKLFLGGESLLHPQIDQMIHTVSDNGLYCQINTNATTLTRELSEKIIKAGIDKITFSFDGYNRSLYEEIRRNAKYNVTLQNILTFLEIKKNLGQGKPLTVIQAIDFSSCYPYQGISPEEWKNFQGLFNRLPVDSFRKIKAHNFAGKIDRHKPITDSYSPCTFLWYSMSILWDGTVVPCCLDTKGDYPLGNVRNDKLADLWNGLRLVKVRESMRKRDLKGIPICKNCDVVRRHRFFGIPTNNIRNFLKENVLHYSKA